jgi:hypothetical protein
MEDQIYLLLPMLKSENPAEIVRLLIEKDIRYFLLPVSGHYAYPIYSYYYDKFLLFKIVTQQQVVPIDGEVFSFTLLRSFQGSSVNLYELRSLNVTE